MAPSQLHPTSPLNAVRDPLLALFPVSHAPPTPSTSQFQVGAHILLSHLKHPKPLSQLLRAAPGPQLHPGDAFLPGSSCFLHCCAMPAETSAKLCASAISLQNLHAYGYLLFTLHTPAAPPSRRTLNRPGKMGIPHSYAHPCASTIASPLFQ
ncbi:hypothetical protein HYPSUDRAFT_210374 [Hypholoma sublateritium FD-334 SS-4]|uniref:Uncharacterized protein n=1 Tax=Hypholoma sublateritium (strain FD-334 SS-4) TaxID=945553 RepID=A0A0D2LP44_HYPSF|nr:hypothetical protein HYPSUDRAFT_210374 [Hypholoma sublateritium FD-334 SS-4]